MPGYIGIRCGYDGEVHYGQYAELYIPPHDRFRFMHEGGRILRDAPEGMTAPNRCLVSQAQVLPPSTEDSPEVSTSASVRPSAPAGRICARDGCSGPVAGRKRICDACRSSEKTTTSGES